MITMIRWSDTPFRLGYVECMPLGTGLLKVGRCRPLLKGLS